MMERVADVFMNVKEIISQMTLEEKASLCSGEDFWHTKAVERLQIPAMMVSDGPHGLRKQDLNADHLGMNESIKAICFPTGCAMAASFDRELVAKIGQVVGNECQAEDLGVVLGPAMNIKRSPLCGRNFEYFSEDPYLTGELATAIVNGIQSKNVGTSVKHFLANSQEHRRMSSDSRVDERTLREIYLSAFENVIKNAKPWTVMCSYNSVNGTYASENHVMLTGVLRDEWGYEGFVMSDWGAVNDRVAGVRAGLDLEMPDSGGINDAKIVEAVKTGQLPESVVDQAVERILNILDKYLTGRDENAVWDKEADHQFARQAAGECIVLLKNENQVLPLKKTEKVAFIGEFAKSPRYQGGGSSHINSYKIDNAFDEASKYGVFYAKGYDIKADRVDISLIQEAVKLSSQTDKVVIFAGLPDDYESEGYDRVHMGIPAGQLALIRAVAEVSSNVVVVLHNGSPVEMPWKDDVSGIVELYLSGEAAGAAIVDVLYGDVNPSGKLPETFPVKIEDNPSYLYFWGEGDVVEYREGVFVGYRYYDKKKMDVLFPFGYGLSYTTFAYDNMRIDKTKMTDTENVTVSVDITNTGDVAGKEVVQLYVIPKTTDVIRPEKELKGFAKVALNPGETKTVTFVLEKRAFAYWNTTIHDWYVQTADYEIAIGKSSREIECQQTIHVTSTVKIPKVYSVNSLFGDLIHDDKAMPIVAPYMERVKEAFVQTEEGSAASEAISEEMIFAMLKYMPLRGVRSFAAGKLSEEDIQNMVKQLNAL